MVLSLASASTLTYKTLASARRYPPSFSSFLHLADTLLQFKLSLKQTRWVSLLPDKTFLNNSETLLSVSTTPSLTVLHRYLR